jgi:hypothetical protein
MLLRIEEREEMRKGRGGCGSSLTHPCTRCPQKGRRRGEFLNRGEEWY